MDPPYSPRLRMNQGNQFFFLENLVLKLHLSKNLSIFLHFQILLLLKRLRTLFVFFHGVDFALQSRVMNKPHDVFGTWLTESYLLSGNFHVLTRQRSCSVLWLNKATQEIKSEDETVVLQLFKFINENHSAVRSVKVSQVC